MTILILCGIVLAGVGGAALLIWLSDRVLDGEEDDAL